MTIFKNAKKNYIFLLTLITALLITALFWSYKNQRNLSNIHLTLEAEESNAAGDIFSASTQSFSRGHHHLDNSESIQINRNKNSFDIYFKFKNQSKYELSFQKIPYQFIFPQIYYSEFFEDEFDAFNLRLHEFSRNGLSLPFGGERSFDWPSFKTNFPQQTRWIIKDNFKPIPNPFARPLRMSIANNCLEPGLWEINATDGAGEIFHAWFNFPLEAYFDIVSQQIGSSISFAKNALSWSEKKVELQLDRLRKIVKPLEITEFIHRENKITYSSQEARRKISRNMLNIDGVENAIYSDAFLKPIQLAKFIPPGIYSFSKKQNINLTDYIKPRNSEFYLVKPKTFYPGNQPDQSGAYLEIVLNFESGISIIIGNVPIKLLNQKEDFPIWSFGVGSVKSSELSERKFLRNTSKLSPSFAYVAKKESSGKFTGINNHAVGFEEIYIRSYPTSGSMLITISSYERIFDVLKFNVRIPDSLVGTLAQANDEYLPPLFLTFKNNNTR